MKKDVYEINGNCYLDITYFMIHHYYLQILFINSGLEWGGVLKVSEGFSTAGVLANIFQIYLAIGNAPQLYQTLQNFNIHYFLVLHLSDLTLKLLKIVA